MTNEELQAASKQVMDAMISKTEELVKAFGISREAAMTSVIADQVCILLVLEQERKRESQMPTRKERDTVAKLMLVVANAMDENRKEAAYDDDATLLREGRMRPEFTLEQLRPQADEAMAEAQAMLASWGN